MTTAPARTPLDGIVEFFTLSRASAQLTRLGEGRGLVASVLTLGRQRAEAAETLWSNGHTAEALRLACGSLEAALDSAAQFAATMKLEDAPAPAVIAPIARRAPPAETREPTGEVALESTDASGEPPASDAQAEPSSNEPEPAEPPTSPTEPDASVEEPVVAAPSGQAVALPVESSNARWRAALVARATRPSRIERVATAATAMRAATLPTYDSEVSSTHADLFQNVMDARHIVDAALGATIWSSGEMNWARARRALGAAFVLVAVMTGMYFVMHDPEGTFVSASDVWSQSPTFVADMAVDGRRDTAWLLPDRATGWLEIRSSPGRRVESVQIINTANSPHHDRGTEDYRLEIYAHGELARSFDGHFDWSDSPAPVVHEVGLDEVERVRFVVLSFHRTGGGVAELTVR